MSCIVVVAMVAMVATVAVVAVVATVAMVAMVAMVDCGMESTEGEVWYFYHAPGIKVISPVW